MEHLDEGDRVETRCWSGNALRQGFQAGCELVGVDIRSEDLAANGGLDVRLTHNIAADGLRAEAAGSALICRASCSSKCPMPPPSHRNPCWPRRGSATVDLFAGRWSVFAVLNRLLRDAVFRPGPFRADAWSVRRRRVSAYYDGMDPAAALSVFRQAGFEGLRATSAETCQPISVGSPRCC
jgi:hypothetical protein